MFQWFSDGTGGDHNDVDEKVFFSDDILTGIILATLPVVLRFSQEIRGYALLLSAQALSFLFGLTPPAP